MAKILIKNIALPDGRQTDILIEGRRIAQIAPRLSAAATAPAGAAGPADIIIDGAHKVALPAFVNMHTHAAMTLFRGYGDDMPLMPWLKTKIWPNEAKMTEEDIYWGAKLACLEMIKSGTANFFDMYHLPRGTARAAAEMGLRATLACAAFDFFDAEQTVRAKAIIERAWQDSAQFNPRVKFAVGPHAPYTVSGPLLQWVNDFTTAHDLLFHLHVAETEEEVENAKKQFGMSPIRYLNSLGILSPRLVMAHVLYLDDYELQLLADNGVKVVHNPAANMKLGSGSVFKFVEMRRAGIKVALGTDGCSSSNNLDMVEAMKLAALAGKAWRRNPEALTAQEMLFAATAQGAEILEPESGRLEAGALADICLADIRLPAFTPNFDFTSNLVYAANGSCIDTLICDGKILMQNKRVNGEEEIMERAAKTAYDLVKR